MSYLFYPIFGASVAIIVGSITSLMSNENEESNLNPMLFSPFVRRFMKRTVVQLHFDEQNDVSGAFESKDTRL